MSHSFAELSPKRRALLEALLRKEGLTTSGKPAIVRRTSSRVAPLSFHQQRLWFLHELDQNSDLYNLCTAFHLTGRLNVGALQNALETIVARHEVLRTTYTARDGVPVQVIAESRPFELEMTDLSHVPRLERNQEVQRFLCEEASRPFDLSVDLMLRARVLRLGLEENILVLVIHHIASDEWSHGVLFQELAALYEAFSLGQPSPLPELPIQYADYAVWQRDWLRGDVLENQLSYWKKQLDNISLLQLPTDHPRPTVLSHRGASKSFVLPKDLSEKLKTLGRKEGATLFMTLLAAFQILLHRYTGEEDIAVGSPIAGRNPSEIEGLIGFFVNTLVLRTDLSGNPTFRQLLARVRDVTLGAYGHQDIPFEKLLEELKPQRDLSRTPLFQVFFNMLNVAENDLKLYGLKVESLILKTADIGSQFDLTMYVQEQLNGIHLTSVSNADLFARHRMIEMLRQYRYLLEQIVAGPEKPIGSYSLVTPESRPLLPDPSVILVSPPLPLVTDIFLSWSKQIPAHPAISQGQQTWTYAELAQGADALARLIVASGLAPREVVAVYGEPSFGLIAAMIATLLSGGVLLLLDHTLPIQRKQRMLREAKAKRLLYVGVKQSDDAWLEEDFRLGIIFIDPQKGCAGDTETGMDLEPIRLPKVETDDPAYIFFTSGTTGVPKGVLGCHKGLSHFLTWQRETFAIEPGDRSAQLTALSFDAVLRDIFLPLTSGATLCLLDANDSPASDAIVAWLKREKITLMHSVPSLAQSWLASERAKYDLGSMRWVFFIGEPLTEALVRQWRTAFPNAAEIVNLYGPTETTLVKCFYRVPADIGPRVQPVGWPISDTQALVLTGENQLCGINEPGEIVLRTPFRSLGYINAPEESQKRFVKNPFRDDPGDLIYFTGDAGCYGPDGSLQILGRRDDQVKIRGVRIEPAEVTATLAGHPLVKSCVVVGRKNNRDETYLAAYVVAAREEKPTTAQLRSYLLERLPGAMVPSVFVLLDSLPLIPNGKVDRKALPEPDNASEPQASYVAPRTPVEEVLGGIWAQLLHVEHVGIHDNFFDLGGHSLLATRVVSKLRETFGVDLPLRFLFDGPTVAGLAERIERARRSEQGLEVVPPIGRVSRDGDLPLSFAQQRLWFLDQLMPGSITYNMSAATRLTGPLDIVALEQSLNEVLRRHEILRTTFRAVEPFQSIAPATPFILPVTDLEHLPEAEREADVRRLATEEARQPFDLAKGPLFRATLLRLGEEDHIFQCAMHHAVSDGWSIEIFNKEIGLLYHSFSTDQPSPLPELPIQYADFAHWQRQWLQGEVLEAQLCYWKKQLAGAPPSLELPTDRPRPAVQAFHGAHQSLVLRKSLTMALKGLSRQEGVTLFMTLLAAFKVLLSRFTGQEDIVVGTPIAGRNRGEIEPLIGFFINTVALRTDLSGDPSFRELLRRVREVALGAYDHQELPFEKLVEELRPERDLSRTPLFQVFFNMLNLESLESHRPELCGLTAERLFFFEPDSKFDLTFYAGESNEEIHLTWVYNADLFDAATITGMLSCFQNLLDEIVTKAEQRIANLLLWSDPEKEQLISDFNQDLTQTYLDTR